MIDSSREFLIFLIEGKEYGIDILRVQEIMRWMPVTELPATPDYLKGVINLRGVIVPIIDMRLRFGETASKYDSTTVVIVLRASNAQQSFFVGIVVDEVSEVYKVAQNEIKPAPYFGNEINLRFISSIATVNSDIVLLLDANRLLETKELDQTNLCTRPVRQSQLQEETNDA